MSGTLFVVATPIGNLEDITMRALRVLREVRLIAAEDTRRTARLLGRYAIETPTTSLHQHNEAAKTSALLRRLQDGDDVALVSDAGTPTLSDPGAHLIRTAIEAGIRVEPVPGPSAALAALAGSGLDTTTFAFLGFPPTKLSDRKLWLAGLSAAGGTVIFFEAPHRIVGTLKQLLGSIGDCEVSIGRELTKKHEQFVRGPISGVLKSLSDPIGEFTVVLSIGHKTENTELAAPSPADLTSELTRITAGGTLSRRRAIQQMAREHGMAPNDVYAAIEVAKKSVK